MQKREKVMLVVMPYGLAAYLWFSLANPALVAGQDKNSELEDKRREQIELKTKLFDLQRAKKAHEDLEKDIQHLRSSVPKNPDIDLLVIDLEKMCLDSDIELVSVKPPEGEKAKQIEAAEKLEAEAAGKLSPGAKTQEKAKIADKKGKAAAKKPDERKKKEEPVTSGLSKLAMEVKVTGYYPNYINLMRRLESYERVVGINHIDVTRPAAKEKDKDKRDEKQLDISFMLTAYYLP